MVFCEILFCEYFHCMVDKCSHPVPDINLIASWRDSFPGGHEIFFKKNIQDRPACQ